ncbi:MAG: hypothetical protein U5J78_06440 [Parasphingorhabdus sp.]|nr:hypothetical protein [Parasphingorhabdus sp.]
MNRENQQQRSKSSAGGFFVAIGTIGGAILGGAIFYQPSAGLLIGFAVGACVATVIWLRER